MAAAALAVSARALHGRLTQSSLAKPQVSEARNSSHITIAAAVRSMRGTPRWGYSSHALNVHQSVAAAITFTSGIVPCAGRLSRGAGRAPAGPALARAGRR